MRGSMQILLISAIVTSCSWSNHNNDGDHGNENPGPVLESCDSVVTEEAIAAYHSSQSQFRVESAGWDVSCRAYVEHNGHRTEVERKGYSTIRVIPQIIYLSLKREDSAGTFLIATEQRPVSDEDVRTIFRDMGIHESEERSPVVDAVNATKDPSYIRFESGAIFYVTATETTRRDGKFLKTFKLQAKPAQQNDLRNKISEFQAGQVAMEWLWTPKKGKSFRIVDKSAGGAVVWSDLEATAVLDSMVHDGAFARAPETFSEAIELALWWDVDIHAVHKVTPDLLSFAAGKWQNPVIADNTVEPLLSALRYIVKILPNDPKTAILSAHDRIDKFMATRGQSLQTAVNYVSSSAWTTSQFEQLVVTSEILYASYLDASWALALEINQRIHFESARGLFFAKAGMLMQKHGLLLRGQSPKADADAIQEIVLRGLNSENIELYFETLGLVTTDFGVGAQTAATASDRWVLTGLVNAANKFMCFDFLRWLDREAQANFNQVLDVVDSLGSQFGLSRGLIDLFKSTFIWLQNSAYLNRNDAFTKSFAYIKNKEFSAPQFDAFKSYFSWLINTVYLNRSEALSKAESVVIIDSLPPVQIDNIRDLTEWYINTIYLNRSEAFRQSEELVVNKKISPEQSSLMKGAVEWLMNVIYLNRSEASAKGQSYIFGGYPLTSESSKQLQDLVHWYINEMYLNRGEALAKTEELVLKFGASKAQTDVLMACGKWLVSDVYLNRSESLLKCEAYVIEQKMDLAKFDRLRAEFKALTGRGVSRSEALKSAEKTVLGA
jgi:hypothetical protein